MDSIHMAHGTNTVIYQGQGSSEVKLGGKCKIGIRTSYSVSG